MNKRTCCRNEVMMECANILAKQLGVEIGEEFAIRETGQICKFCEEDRRFRVRIDIDEWKLGTMELVKLCDGPLHVRKIRWKPKLGDEYWTVFSNGKVFKLHNSRDAFDYYAIRLGNCYKTKEEAEKNAKEWINWFDSGIICRVMRKGS